MIMEKLLENVGVTWVLAVDVVNWWRAGEKECNEIS